MKNKKNNTDSNAKKVLAWIPYILIPILIISGVSLYARQQKNEKPKRRKAAFPQNANQHPSAAMILRKAAVPRETPSPPSFPPP